MQCSVVKSHSVTSHRLDFIESTLYLIKKGERYEDVCLVFTVLIIVKASWDEMRTGHLVATVCGIIALSDSKTASQH